MARLILLNGPPGMSTLARRWVDGHRGSLNLDVDLVRTLVGGWREDFITVGEIVRPVAMSMASTHLAGGRDVIAPQFLDDPSEITAFADLAGSSGAAFYEVVLMDSQQNSLDRFARRGHHDPQPWHHQVQHIVERNGGHELLTQLYDRLIAGLAARPEALVLHSRDGDADQTYRDSLHALAQTGLTNVGQQRRGRKFALMATNHGLTRLSISHDRRPVRVQVLLVKGNCAERAQWPPGASVIRVTARAVARTGRAGCSCRAASCMWWIGARSPMVRCGTASSN